MESKALQFHDTAGTNDVACNAVHNACSVPFQYFGNEGVALQIGKINT